MSDVSRRRRLAGRLMLGAATVALPLTASVSYAAGQPEALESVELAPSVAAVPEPPAPPAAPLAPEAPVAPAAPEAPEAPHAVEKVHVYKFHKDGDADDEQVFVMRGDKGLSEKDRKRFEKMAKKYEFDSEKWADFAEKQAKIAEKMAKEHGQWTVRLESLDKDIEKRMELAMANMPLIDSSCDGADDGQTTKEWVDDKGRKHIAICEKRIERLATRSAAMGLRQARESIARNQEMDADVRDEVLEELDAEIQRIERGDS